ncbi:triphosphoribosyl-dephospho-CoA synthase [Arvimicrobium flavum]|uniref:triphosphoribosyl-dephospho-CoA synthase n=1 Tax=Arvimicrobium flavum TaxID=3393320 RepID=UPI00237B21A0|nr:triphosphoribosyl-dephospho-CoA synthase [Mesorhizobium shangrilense]
MTHSRERIQAAYEAACRMEIEALKPGNVHVFADGHRMSAEQFLVSARVSSGPLTDPALSVGRRILKSVQATRRAVDANTNLGIILLCAPLARAAEMPGELRPNLRLLLDAMDVEDAAEVFEAIVLASPGGLGSADAHDVRVPAQAPLLAAMREAADRDRIARQYATGFEDVFGVGLPALAGAISKGEGGMWPTIFAYMAFLCGFPDSHVARKHGTAIAAAIQDEARAVSAALETAGDEATRVRLLTDLDRSLKARGLNPGTSADLTVASLLVHMLGDRLA